ncbi:response regulator transcription factor [soil metagenome]
MEKILRIILAEDHETVRAGIKLLLNSHKDMEVVGEAGNGEAALALAAEILPDLVIMDVSMPIMNGLQATKRLRKKCPDVKILALTRHAEDAYLQQLVTAGVNGYVLKQSAPSELVNAIRSVASGHSYLDAQLTDKVMGNYAIRSEILRVEPTGILTSREEEVIRMIAIGHSNKEIAHKLEISVKTVEAHKANAMRKLNFSGRIDIVKYAVMQDWLHGD